jgi:hypothetical protein
LVSFPPLDLRAIANSLGVIFSFEGLWRSLNSQQGLRLAALMYLDAIHPSHRSSRKSPLRQALKNCDPKTDATIRAFPVRTAVMMIGAVIRTVARIVLYFTHGFPDSASPNHFFA